MAQKGSSKNRKESMSAYKLESRSLKNRTKRLKAHIKACPNDAGAKERLAEGLQEYRRRKPRNKVWSPSKREYAQQLSLLGYNGRIALRDIKKEIVVKYKKEDDEK